MVQFKLESIPDYNDQLKFGDFAQPVPNLLLKLHQKEWQYSVILSFSLKIVSKKILQSKKHLIFAPAIRN